MPISSVLRFFLFAVLVAQLLDSWQVKTVAASDHNRVDMPAPFTTLTAEGETSDYLSVSPSQELPLSEMNVVVHVGSETWLFESQASTVGEFLGEYGILVGPLDSVSPELAYPIEDGLAVTISRLERIFEIRESRIPAGVVWKPDLELPLDQIQTRIVGKPGLIGNRSRLISKDGRILSRDSVDHWTVQPALDTEVFFGQRITKKGLNISNNQTIFYWRKTRMLATSYSAANSGTPKDAPWYGYTFSGEPMDTGVIAADLNVLPLRTRLYIPGYGNGNVLDTGGGLEGLHIDLGYSDEEYVSWYRVVDVYWLWPPPTDTSEIVWILPPAPSRD